MHKQIYYSNPLSDGTSRMLFIEADEFINASVASNLYWNITSTIVNSPIASVNNTYKGFNYSYLFNWREKSTWYAWGIDNNYLFDIQGTYLPITNESLVMVIHAQIDAMT